MSERVARHGPMLSVSLAAQEKLYLRRGTLIASSRPMSVRTRKDFKGAKGGLKSLFGGTLVVNEWTADGPTQVTAGLGFYGEVITIAVTPDAQILSHPKCYLGHRGAVSRAMSKPAKKEFWLPTRVTGEGELYLQSPAGCTVMPIDGERHVLDYERIVALIGEFDLMGEALDLKSWMKSGETDSLLVSGKGHAVIAHADLSSLDGDSGGGGLFDTVAGFFT